MQIVAVFVAQLLLQFLFQIVPVGHAVDQTGKLLLKGFTSVSFAEDGANRTKLTLKSKAIGQVPFAPQMIQGMEPGWMQSFDSLEKHLAA